MKFVEKQILHLNMKNQRHKYRAAEQWGKGLL